MTHRYTPSHPVPYPSGRGIANPVPPYIWDGVAGRGRVIEPRPPVPASEEAW